MPCQDHGCGAGLGHASTEPGEVGTNSDGPAGDEGKGGAALPEPVHGSGSRGGPAEGLHAQRVGGGADDSDDAVVWVGEQRGVGEGAVAQRGGGGGFRIRVRIGRTVNPHRTHASRRRPLEVVE